MNRCTNCRDIVFCHNASLCVNRISCLIKKASRIPRIHAFNLNLANKLRHLMCKQLHRLCIAILKRRVIADIRPALFAAINTDHKAFFTVRVTICLDNFCSAHCAVVAIRENAVNLITIFLQPRASHFLTCHHGTSKRRQQRRYVICNNKLHVGAELAFQIANNREHTLTRCELAVAANRSNVKIPVVVNAHTIQQLHCCNRAWNANIRDNALVN